MRKLIAGLVSIAAMFVLSCTSGPGTPQEQMNEIESILNKNIPMTSEQTSDVNRFVADGKRLMEEGKTKESSEALEKALKILHRAEDVHVFNKAE